MRQFLVRLLICSLIYVTPGAVAQTTIFGPVKIVGPVTIPTATGGGSISIVEWQCGNWTITSPPCFDVGIGSDPQTITLGTPTTAGEAIFIFSQNGAAGTTYGSIADSASQTYTQHAVIQQTAIGNHFSGTIWYKCGSASGVTSVTRTLGAGDGWADSVWFVWHVKGLASSGCADVAANFNSGGAPYVQVSPFSSDASGTTNYANELLICPILTTSGTTATLAATGSWSIGMQTDTPDGEQAGVFFQIVSSTGNYTCTGTGTTVGSVYSPAIATFH